MSRRTGYFRAGESKQLDDDVTWHPNGWHTGDGDVRLPIQREKEPGVNCDVSLVIKHDGKTKIHSSSH